MDAGGGCAASCGFGYDSTDCCCAEDIVDADEVVCMPLSVVRIECTKLE